MIRIVRTVDTRFFLTHFLTDDSEIKKKTIAKLHELRKESALVPTIVLHEVYKFEFQKIRQGFSGNSYEIHRDLGNENRNFDSRDCQASRSFEVQVFQPSNRRCNNCRNGNGEKVKSSLLRRRTFRSCERDKDRMALSKISHLRLEND